MGDETVTLELGKDAALVLFELIADYNLESEIKLPNAYDRIAVNLLIGAFETALAEPFRPDYLQLVKAARDRLQERFGNTAE